MSGHRPAPVSSSPPPGAGGPRTPARPWPPSCWPPRPLWSSGWVGDSYGFWALTLLHFQCRPLSKKSPFSCPTNQDHFIPVAILAERASISRVTLSKVEKGEPGVAVGTYATILFTLGM